MILPELCGEVWAHYLNPATGDQTGHLGHSNALISVKTNLDFLYKNRIKRPTTRTRNALALTSGYDCDPIKCSNMR